MENSLWFGQEVIPEWLLKGEFRSLNLADDLSGCHLLDGME